MRFRTVSRMLVAAVLAGGAATTGGCGARQKDTEVVTPPPPAPARPEGWTRVSILKLLDQYAPVPADARGVYVRTPHCTNCIEIVRGPEMYGACADSPCAAPLAQDPYAERLLYLTADGHLQVVPWPALAPVVEKLIAERGAGASDDPEIAILRMLRDGGKLARTDAWVELTANGTFRVSDGFPAELRVPPAQPMGAYDPSQPLPNGVAVPMHMVQHPDVALAMAKMEEQQGQGGFMWVMYRPLARGALVTFGSGGGCSTSGTMSFVVEDGAAALVDQMEMGFPDECRPRGRRPEGLASRVAEHDDAAARWYAESMHLEAASVPAFKRLAAELAALGAPARLVRAARAAARDEVRHAATMTRLGVRIGAAHTDVVVTPVAERTIEQIAIENAVEGCVHEGFAAVLCDYQARAAGDPALAPAMADIARDEQTHAGLAFAIAAWLATQLSSDARFAVDSAVDRALVALPALAAAEAARYANAAALLGLPSLDDARALADGYVTWMRTARGPRPEA